MGSAAWIRARASMAWTPSGRATTGQFEFGDLRQVVGHPGDPQQHVPQCGEVGGGGAGAAEQQRRGGCRADEVVGVGVGERGEPGGAAGQRVGGRAAEAEQHQRAEDLLLKHADLDLDAAGDHRLDNDGGEPAAEGLPQRAEPAPDLTRVMEVEHDSADIDRCAPRRAGLP